MSVPRVRFDPALWAVGLVAVGLLAACGSDDGSDSATEEPETGSTSTTSTTAAPAAEETTDGGDGRLVLELSFDGLEPLGDDFDYEGWVIVGGEPVSTGVFDIGEDGSIESAGTFQAPEDGEAVVISIEPADDPISAPSETKILGGTVGSDGTFELTIDFPSALGTDFSEASGQYILGTPTDDPDGNELSGVWFLTVPGSVPGLQLPELPPGWAYEGWAVIDGIPVTTGRFTDPTAADDFAGFSGPSSGPPLPGEDFITNAPEGLTFPTTLIGSSIVISVEPDADNSPTPFALKPLVAEVPQGTGDHQNLELGPGPVAVAGSGAIVASSP